eukprot:CAMPEP_0172609718 /NCGR_PEP_ID=MMETSP1068-20121228/29644_1 /TAXON_ID=35684 /ORGANISM="Pseudopedinella elastica, Strain CCMP716" /LENGTH=84 /DNA_ID=CAMNT_0013413285 /DNA_START=98 /DNA_END=353 /DNA_ORIENTATION=+
MDLPVVLPRDNFGFVVHPPKLACLVGGFDCPEHPRNTFVYVDQALPPRHVGSNVARVQQQHAGFVFEVNRDDLAIIFSAILLAR